MTYQEYFGQDLAAMQQTEQTLLDLANQFANQKPTDLKPVIYTCSRLKSPESTMQKLKKHQLPLDASTAQSQLFDLVGVRIVCAFAEDVYKTVHWLRRQTAFTIIQEKDYISYPKPNGYRSYHLQIQMKDDQTQKAEIQVRTIATDFWAALEHQLKYKKDVAHAGVIRAELKRCADEIASVDLSMQTIRDIIRKTVAAEEIQEEFV